MAKITIVIEDIPGPGEKVKVTSDPSFEQMAMSMQRGEPTTGAMGFAVKAANAIREESYKNREERTLGKGSRRKKSPLWIP